MNNSTSFFFVNGTNGNVGISSTVPGSTLDVLGSIRSTTFAMTGNGASSNYVLTSIDTFGNATWSSLGGGISGWTVNTPYLYETNSGNNVGIGTTNPTGFEIEGKNIGIGTAFTGGTGEAALTVMSGSVGIGTWVPTGQLAVQGSGTGIVTLGTWSGGNTFGAIYLNNSFATNNSYNFVSAGTDLFVNRASGSAIRFRENNGIDQMVIVAGGNVGIGTPIPSSKFVVNGGVGIGTSLTNNAYINNYIAPSGGLIVQGNVGIGTFNPFGGQLIVPTTNGNVGIGSLTPGQALDVTGTTRTQLFAMSNNGPSANYVLTSVDTFGNATWSSLGSGISGWTVNTPYLYETNSANNVGIGTTNPTGFEIEGKNVGIGTAFTNSAALTVMSNVGIGTWVPAPGTTLDVEGTPSGHFYVTNSGNVGVGTWAPQATFQVAGGGTSTDFQIMRAANQDYFFIKAPGGVSPIAANMGVNGGTAISVAVGNNVGIGTIAPMASLAIWNGSGNANVGIGTFIAAGGSLIVAEGNVGIGSAFPGQELDVTGTTRTQLFAMSNNGPSSNYVLTSVDTFGNATWSSLGGGISGWTVNTPYLYETNSSNNVGIGTTNPTGFEIEGKNVGIGTAFTGGTGEAVLTVMNGNVGIGTWIPVSPLTVIDTGTSSSSALTVQRAGNATQYIGLSEYSGSYHWIAGVGSKPFIFTNKDTNYGSGFEFDVNNASVPAGGTRALNITTGGNIGIGSVLPGSLLDVEGTYPVVFYGHGTNENVGIGSASPGQALDVTGTTRTQLFAMSNNGPSSNYVLTSVDTFGNATWSSLGGGISGWTVNTPYLYETNSANNVGIGTTNPTGFEIEGKNVGIGTAFTGGTGEGALTVMNGNVGIGTWVPKGQLDVEGTLSTAIFGGNIGIGTGGANANPSLYFINRPNYGLYYSPGASGVAITVNGTSSLLVNATNGLKIPSGSIFSWASGTTADGTTADTGISRLGSDIVAVGNGSSANATGTLVAANIGIGSTNPGSLLDINGTVVGGVRILGGNNVGIGTTFISTSGLSVMNGNVGIGTWIPGTALQVANTISFVSEYNNGSQGAAFTINWNNGNKQKVTLTGSTSHTATFTAPSSGVTNLLLEVIQGSGTDTVSWTGSSNIKWPSNTAPTLTTTNGQVDVITCYYNGTDYFCGSNLNYTP